MTTEVYAPRPTPRLRELREAAGYSREQLAVAAGLCSRTLIRAETGQAVPTVETTLRLAAALGVPVTDLTDLLHDNGGPARAAAAQSEPVRSAPDGD